MSDTTEKKYIMLAIYDKGDAVITSTVDACFMSECTVDLAFIKKTHGEPYPLSMGLKAYPPHLAAFDIMSINNVNAWITCRTHGWLNWTRFDNENPLRWALSQSRLRNPKVFDYLLSEFPDTQINDMLYKIRNLPAATWALAHGADPNYDGLKYSMEYVLCYNRCPEADQIYKAIYGKDRPN